LRAVEAEANKGRMTDLEAARESYGHDPEPYEFEEWEDDGPR
jgi:hypothetical protein